MSKYISGKKFIELRNLRGFEFFHQYIKRGLQPYDPVTGKPVPPPDISRKISNIKARLDYNEKHLKRLKRVLDPVEQARKCAIQAGQLGPVGRGSHFQNSISIDSLYTVQKENPEEALTRTQKEIDRLNKSLSSISSKGFSWANYQLPDSQVQAKEIDECLGYIYAWKEIEEIDKKSAPEKEEFDEAFLKAEKCEPLTEEKETLENIDHRDSYQIDIKYRNLPIVLNQLKPLDDYFKSAEDALRSKEKGQDQENAHTKSLFKIWNLQDEVRDAGKSLITQSDPEQLERKRDEIRRLSIWHYIKYTEDPCNSWISDDLVSWLQITEVPVDPDVLQEKATAKCKRDENRERSVWEKRIQPIVQLHSLMSSYGGPFEYVFLDGSDSFSEYDIHKMKLRASLLCEGLKSNDFSKEILGPLYNEITQVRGKYTQIDIKDRFIKLLNEMFSDGTLPHFLEFLDREKAPVVNKLEGEKGEIDRVSKPALLEPKKKLRRSQIHRQKCRKIAQEFWDEDPNITIVDMMNRQKIIDASKKSNGTMYLEKTLRNWIKDLCPNRSPGRRPKEANHL